jgi:hypothetical protein
VLVERLLLYGRKPKICGPRFFQFEEVASLPQRRKADAAFLGSQEWSSGIALACAMWIEYPLKAVIGISLVFFAGRRFMRPVLGSFIGARKGRTTMV